MACSYQTSLCLSFASVQIFDDICFALPQKVIIHTVNMQLVRQTLSVHLVKRRACGGLHLSGVLLLE